jgi:hypothetical protein
MMLKLDTQFASKIDEFCFGYQKYLETLLEFNLIEKIPKIHFLGIKKLIWTQGIAQKWGIHLLRFLLNELEFLGVEYLD